jgi:hypothetical protein
MPCFAAFVLTALISHLPSFTAGRAKHAYFDDYSGLPRLRRRLCTDDILDFCFGFARSFGVRKISSPNDAESRS